ncbi:hypothetical protein TrRE_jg1279 [Triparma retinervis]|uniref:Uncharacterized protein n=1 Tax=Triparma retinervis TaxID=2557542 RepID=A0A9W7AJ45_9STRA|nr:hypothetical protein TrRE_jg1279 [Triparma retinervis]
MDGTLTPPGLIDFPHLRSSIRSIASTDPNNANNQLNLDEDALILASQLSPSGRSKCSLVLKSVEDKVLQEMSLSPGVVEVMRYCCVSGLRAAVVTRNIERVASRLSSLIGVYRSDSTAVLDPLIARNSLDPLTGLAVPPKPSPAALLSVCGSWGLRPADVLMVGDSWEDDVQAAGRAGCRSVLIDTGVDNSTGGRRSDLGEGRMYEPDWTVREFKDVMGVLVDNAPP